MTDIFRIALQACDPKNNRWRFYRLEAGRDLFGDLVVRLHYGRMGSQGHCKTYLVQDADEGAKLVRACLQRRQSAPKRIGVAYEVMDRFDPLNWTG